MRSVLAGAAVMLMAACATAPAAPPQSADEGTQQDTCGAARFAHYVGHPADHIDRAALPARTRVITPDMMVTQDFSPERLNIMVGTDGRVGSLRCF